MDIKPNERKFRPPTGKKSPQDWDAVMHDEGGLLGRYTDEIFRSVEDLSAQALERAINKVSHESSVIRSLPPRYDFQHTNALQFPELSFFKLAKRYRIYSPRSYSRYIQAASSRKSLADLMLKGGALLEQLLCESHDKHTSSGKLVLEGHPQATVERSSIDLRDHLSITLDNVQTVMDAVIMLVPFCRNEKEFMQALKRMLGPCPNSKVEIEGTLHEINPRGYSYLELMGLAPFTYLASTREQQPKSYRGKAIVDIRGAHLFDPMFIYMITRMKLTERQDRYNRHGGCPVLYPQYRHLHLIQRLGRFYYGALQEFEKRDDEEWPILQKPRRIHGKLRGE